MVTPKEGRVALITGGGRGLGREIAIALGARGIRVAVAARTREELAQTVDMVMDAGGRAMYFNCDVSDSEDVRNLVRAVELKFGVVDILVNNASIVGPVKELKDVSEGELDHCMQVNFKAMYLTAHELIPVMIKKGRGWIINVTSGLTGMVMPRLGAYSISKAAVNHFTRVLAAELEPHNIRVNGLDPGVMDTGMQEYLRGIELRVSGPEIYRTFRELKESDMLRSPAEVAKLAAFLVSSAADGITGEIGTEEYFTRLGYLKAA